MSQPLAFKDYADCIGGSADSPAVNPTIWSGFARDRDLVGLRTEREIMDWSDFFKERFGRRAPNPEEGCDPRDNIRYQLQFPHDVEYTDIGAVKEQLDQAVIDGCSQKELAEIMNSDQGAVGCDPNTYEGTYGHDIFRGGYSQVAFGSPERCIIQLHQAKHVPQWWAALKKDMPREAAIAQCIEIFRWVVRNGTNFAAGTALDPKKGSVPMPLGTLDYGDLHYVTMWLHGNGYQGTPVFGMSYETARKMANDYYLNEGIEIQSARYQNSTNSIPAEGDWQFEQVRVKILKNPALYYVNAQGQLTRIDMRVHRAGTGGGVVTDLNFKARQNCLYECDGNFYPMVELVQFMQQGAADLQAFALPNIDIPGVQMDMGTLMQAQLVTGAYIECNEWKTKFKLHLRDIHKKVPNDPELMGVISTIYSPFCRFKNEPCCHEELMAKAMCAELAPAPPPTGVSCENKKLGLPSKVQPILNEDGTAEVPCGEGTLCPPAGPLTVKPGTTVKVPVPREGGSCDGEASITGTTADGTGIAGTDYIAVEETLEWEDGCGGTKVLSIEIPEDATPGAEFCVDWTAATGAPLGEGCPAKTQLVILAPSDEDIC